MFYVNHAKPAQALLSGVQDYVCKALTEEIKCTVTLPCSVRDKWKIKATVAKQYLNIVTNKVARSITLFKKSRIINV